MVCLPLPFYYNQFWQVCLCNATSDVESHLVDLKDLFSTLQSPSTYFKSVTFGSKFIMMLK